MKRKILIFIVFICFSIKGFSQFEIGISAGHNYSKTEIQRKYVNDFGMKGIDNWNFGVFITKQRNEAISFKLGLNYFEKGFEQNLTPGMPVDLDTAMSLTFNTKYLDIPFTIDTKINIMDFYFVFTTGAYLGVGLSGEVGIESRHQDWVYTYETSVGWTKSSDEIYYDSRNTPDYNLTSADYSGLHRLDYGAILGIGFGYKMIELKVDYYYGLRNLMIEYSMYEVTRNRNLDISLNYKFKLKEK